MNTIPDTFEAWQVEFGLGNGKIFVCGNQGNLAAIDTDSGDISSETRVSDEFHMALKGTQAGS